MAQPMVPVIQEQEAVVLRGLMSVYESQAEASEKIPLQWQEFLALPFPEIRAARHLYGASPPTADHKIHYLCGVPVETQGSEPGLEELLIPRGTYAIFAVADADQRGSNWGRIFQEWLPASAYTERPTPEFERFTKAEGSITLTGSVELGVPVEARSGATANQEE